MKDLTVGKEWKVILNFTLPMLLGNIFQQFYNVVDSIIVGNYLGKEALSAVGASFPIIFVLISLVIGIGTGSTIIISQYFGAKNYEKVKITINTMYIMLFFASILISVIGIVFSEQIFLLIDLPADILPQANTYLVIILTGTIAMFGYNGTNAILRGLGDSKTPLYFLIISTIINICLDLLFVVIFGWGIEGVAIATVIAQGGAFLSGVLYLNKYHSLINVSFFKLNFDKKIFIKSLKIGLPSGGQNMIVALGMAALFKIVNAFGTDVIAAYSIVGRIDSFAIISTMNFAMALSTFVGQNIGAKKIDRIRKGLISTIIMTTILSVIFTLISVFFGHSLMSVFTPDSKVIEIGAKYLIIVSSFYFSFSILFNINSVFKGAGDTIVPMFITLFALWFIRIPISYYLSQQFGEIGIWWGVPTGWIVGMCHLLSYIIYRDDGRKK